MLSSAPNWPPGENCKATCSRAGIPVTFPPWLMATMFQSYPVNPGDAGLADVAEPQAERASEVRTIPTPASAGNLGRCRLAMVCLRRAIQPCIAHYDASGTRRVASAGQAAGDAQVAEADGGPGGAAAEDDADGAYDDHGQDHDGAVCAGRDPSSCACRSRRRSLPASSASAADARITATGIASSSPMISVSLIRAA